MVRQKKTGRPVKFELTDQTRQAVDDYLRASGKKSGEFLFTSRRRTDRCMTTRQYARLATTCLLSTASLNERDSVAYTTTTVLIAWRRGFLRSTGVGAKRSLFFLAFFFACDSSLRRRKLTADGRLIRAVEEGAGDRGPGMADRDPEGVM
jgi:hypothetical protein